MACLHSMDHVSPRVRETQGRPSVSDSTPGASAMCASEALVAAGIPEFVQGGSCPMSDFEGSCSRQV